LNGGLLILAVSSAILFLSFALIALRSSLRSCWLKPRSGFRPRGATVGEEMRAEFDLRIGKNISLKGTGRLIPAGIVTGGIVTVGILLATAALVRAARS
jgi:hypothetical protein